MGVFGKFSLVPPTRGDVTRVGAVSHADWNNLPQSHRLAWVIERGGASHVPPQNREAARA